MPTRNTLLALAVVLLAACSETTGPDPIPQVPPPDMPRVEFRKADGDGGGGGGGGGGGLCTSPSDSAECLARAALLAATGGAIVGTECGAVALCGVLWGGFLLQEDGYLNAPDCPGCGARAAQQLWNWGRGDGNEPTH